MTKLNEIYKCEICGNITEVLHSGQGSLVCCGQDMKLLEENTIEKEGNEKHIPIIEEIDSGVKVKVGSIEHPMLEEHYIEFIELIINGKVYRQNLKPEQKPEAEFYVDISGKNLSARAYCNVHGLWKSA